MTMLLAGAFTPSWMIRLRTSKNSIRTWDSQKGLWGYLVESRGYLKLGMSPGSLWKQIQCEYQSIGKHPRCWIRPRLISSQSYDKLQSWRMSDRAYIVPRGVSASDIRNLESIAKAYYSAAVIYFYSMISSLTPEFIGYPLHLIWDTGARLKHEAIIQCFDALWQIPDGAPCESALVLPLFIMGCEADFPAQQAYAIQRLQRLEISIGLGNINRARIIVEQVKANVSFKKSLKTDGPKWSRATDSLGWDLIIT